MPAHACRLLMGIHSEVRRSERVDVLYPIGTIVRLLPVRRAAVLLLSGLTVAFGQSTLPATNPTAPSRAGAPLELRAAPPKAANRAQVTYAAGRLEVNADNSSLNQILHDISRQTGMKITGGVMDEPVFGKYGPDSPARVIANLLAGTGINMMLRETASEAPAELILTAREGGVTPPSPNAAIYDEDHAPPPRPTAPDGQHFPPQGSGMPPPAMNSSGPSPQDGSPDAPPVTAPNPKSPKTPQEIYQQLQQLQQQQVVPK